MSEKLKSKNSAGLTKSASTHFVRLDEVEKMIAAAKDEVLRDARIEINRQVQIDKASLITVFSIFASFFSFFSVGFPFLKELKGPGSVSGFLCILFTLLFGFNVGLDYLVKNNLNNNANYTWKYVALLMLVFMVGVILVLLPDIKEILPCKLFS